MMIDGARHFSGSSLLSLSVGTLPASQGAMFDLGMIDPPVPQGFVPGENAAPEAALKDARAALRLPDMPVEADTEKAIPLLALLERSVGEVRKPEGSETTGSNDAPLLDENAETAEPAQAAALRRDAARPKEAAPMPVPPAPVASIALDGAPSADVEDMSRASETSERTAKPEHKQKRDVAQDMPVIPMTVPAAAPAPVSAGFVPGYGAPATTPANAKPVLPIAAETSVRPETPATLENVELPETRTEIARPDAARLQPASTSDLDTPATMQQPDSPEAREGAARPEIRHTVRDQANPAVATPIQTAEQAVHAAMADITSDADAQREAERPVAQDMPAAKPVAIDAARQPLPDPAVSPIARDMANRMTTATGEKTGASRPAVDTAPATDAAPATHFAQGLHQAIAQAAHPAPVQASAVPAAAQGMIAFDAGFIDAMGEQIAMAASSGAPVRLIVNPEHLGRIDIEIQPDMDSGQDKIRLTADNESVRQTLASSQARLEADLKQNGQRADVQVELRGQTAGSQGQSLSSQMAGGQPEQQSRDRATASQGSPTNDFQRGPDAAPRSAPGRDNSIRYA